MGLFDKLKNILFEEEEVELPVITKKEEPVKEVKREVKREVENEIPRFKTVKKDLVNVSEEEVVKEVEKKELKSPFQSFDEEEFERLAAINKNRLLERDRKAREQKQQENRVVSTPKPSYVRNKEVREVVNRSQIQPQVKVVPETTHNFRPSPVISPVYGILDKNYKKDDILPRASSDGTLPKVMDVDSVRQKAFGSLEDEIERTQPLNLFNGQEEPSISDVLLSDEDDDKLVKTAEIKITSFEDEVENDTNLIKDTSVVEESIDNPVVETREEKKDKVENETLESDLFNLIDSMYENKEEK